MADPYHALSKGLEIDGYEIVRVLGSGGFGITYLGFDTNLDKAVAIKEYMPSDLAVRKGDTTVIPKSDNDLPDFNWGLERFLDEARILARFDHKNIVKVHRFFKAHGTAYIVMEYVEGETLSNFFKRSPNLTYSTLSKVVTPVLEGLRLVHESNFLHRDIKPGNVIIREDEVPVLIDFGAARQAVGAKSRSVTAIVTPGYAPIEQYSSRGKQGPWTDIYALGAICYKAITGNLPIDATERVRKDPHIKLIDAQVPKSLGYPKSYLQAIDRALEVEEEDRPQSVNELIEYLSESSETLDENIKTTKVEPIHRSPTNLSSPSNQISTSNRKPILYGAVALGVIAVVGITAVAKLERPSPSCRYL